MEDVSSYTEMLVERFATHGVLVDTNILLLFAVGSDDEEVVRRGSFDRLAAYSLEDLLLLRSVVSLFRNRVTTAHVLTEVSNWVGYLPQDAKVACLSQFQNTFRGFKQLEIDSLDVSGDERFPFLGFTDAALARFADTYLVLTDDARFAGHLNQMGLDALNINHLRQELWLRS